MTSVCGRRSDMEDAVALRHWFCRWNPENPNLKKEVAQLALWLEAEYPKLDMTSVCGRRSDMEHAVALQPWFCRWNPENPDLKKEAALGLETEYPKLDMTSVCGRRSDMEDAVALRPSFCRGNPENSDLKKEAALGLEAEYPKFGMTSICGRRRDMEDAVAICPSFCRLNPENLDHLNFYGVYDGMGGANVALKCKDRLHEIVREEVDRSEDSWEETMERSFSRMDKEVTDWCELQTQSGAQAHTVGSTAVVAIVTPDRIIISNCGDSRAVLCCNGVAVPLSSDHEPDRPDELDRIEKEGGRVIHWDGARVLGVLDTSRAIGCNYLKPFVIPEPEVTIKDRTAEDEFLILASDGLWDVVSNDTACGIVTMCLRSPKPRWLPQSPGSEVNLDGAGGSSDKACSDASILLTKLALARGSKDNISVVVVDLRRDGGHVMLLDPLEQCTKNVAHGARKDQCSPAGYGVAEQNGEKHIQECRDGEDQCSPTGYNVSSTEQNDGRHPVLLDPLEESTKSVARGAREDQCSPTGYSVSSIEQNGEKDIEQCRARRTKFKDQHQHVKPNNDGGHIMLLDALEQCTKNVAHGAREDQFSPIGYSVNEQNGEEDIQECRDGHVVLLDPLEQCTKNVSHGAWEDQCSPMGYNVSSPEQNDGGHVMLLDPLEQSTKNVAHGAGEDQCSRMGCSVASTEKHGEKDIKKCRAKKAKFVDHQQHFGRRCEGAKSLGVTRICSKHGINQAPKWATRKGYSLREERPFEVSTLFMDEKFDSRPLFINMSQFSRSSARPLALPDGCKIVTPLSLSSSEFVASNNRACLVRQNQGDSTASQYERRSTRETSDRQGISTSVCSAEDLQHHFGFKHKDAVKRLVYRCSLHIFDLPRTLQLNFSGGLTAQSASTLHWPIGLPDGGHILSLSKRNIVRTTFKRMSRTMSVRFENHQQHFGSRYEGAANSLAKCISKQNGINPVSMLKWTLRRHWFHRWPFRQSSSSLHWPIGLPDRGHILPLSKMYIVRKTFKRMSRPMSVRFEGHQQHFGSRYEGAANSLAKCISKQRGINLVSVVKWTRRRHGFHRWPFRQGYSFGGERIAKVISLSMVENLVSRLQFLHMLWLARSSRHPLASLSGSKIVGHIAFSSSEFAATNIGAHPSRQDQCGSSASRPEKERTRETRIWEGRASHVFSFEDLQQHFGSKRDDVAKSLGISVSTFKRICRHHGINRWPYRIRNNVWRPPDPHEENNPSPMFNTLPTIGQNTRENEMGGHNPGPNELLPDAFEDVNFWITENGSTAEIEKTPTFNDSFPGNFHHGDFRFSSVFSETESTGGSFKWPFQLEGQSTLATPYSNPNAILFPQSEIASTQVLSENMGNLEERRNLPASQEERFMEGLVCESSNLMFPSCSDAAALCQPVATILNMMPTIPDIIPHFTGGSSEAFQQEGQSTQSTYPHANPNALVFAETQSVSTQMLSENMRSSEVRQNVVAFEEETLPTCSDPNPSQSMPPISYTTPTMQMMSHLTTREHMRSVTLKLTYWDRIIKFPFPLTSGITELKKEVTKRLNLEFGSFDIEYKDEDGDWIFLGCDEDLRNHVQLFSNQVIRLLVVDSGANTTNDCESSRSFKRKRP